MSHTELVHGSERHLEGERSPKPSIVWVRIPPDLFNSRGYMTVDDIKEFADPDAIQWDDFDDAIVGTDNHGRLVYDVNKMIEVLVTRDGMSEEEAMEYLEFNVLCAYVGPLTPVHVYVYR